MKLLYHNTTPVTSIPTSTTRPVTLPIPGCSELCPLSSWLELTASLTPDDWEAECKTELEEADMETGSNVDLPPAILLSSLLVNLILFVFLVRATARYEMRRREYLRL